MLEKVLMKGNEAVGEAAILAGCRHYFGYPITPQNEIAAYMSQRMPQVGGVFLQAESEIGAINMVYGAAAAGKRTMTTSSSPGMSLKVECISYLVGCDLPAVIMNIQRAGPGLGGIAPSQSDYFMITKACGHGDMKLLTFAPHTIQEIADLTMDAFDLADKYRTPVMLLSDGILGQMMEPVEFKPRELPEIDYSWACTTTQGKRERNIINSMTLDIVYLDQLNRNRFKRYDEIEKNEVRSESYMMDDAEIVIVAYGACARVSKNAIDEARKKGIKVGLIRPVTLWPFPNSILQEAAKKAKAFLTVEMSMGQMIYDVRLAIECSRPVDFLGRVGGMIPSLEEVLEKIENISKEVS